MWSVVKKQKRRNKQTNKNYESQYQNRWKIIFEKWYRRPGCACSHPVDKVKMFFEFKISIEIELSILFKRLREFIKKRWWRMT